MASDGHDGAMPDRPDLGRLLTLEPHGTDAWVGPPAKYPWGDRLYGGQVIAQSLRAAGHTVDDAFSVHSCHAYFIRGGTAHEPVRFEVDRIRNGRSFCTRRVVARQSGGAILSLSASYQVHEDEPEASQVVPPDDAGRPEDLPDNGWGFTIDRRSVEHPPGTGRGTGWVRILDELPDEPGVAECGLAFTSDTIQFGAARSGHPDAERLAAEGVADPFMGASLDHAIWFHRPMDPTRWHLYEFRAKGNVNGRGLTSGEVFDEDGNHVASVAQEVLLRLRR